MKEPYIGRSCFVLLCAFGHGLGYRRDGFCGWRCEPLAAAVALFATVPLWRSFERSLCCASRS